VWQTVAHGIDTGEHREPFAGDARYYRVVVEE